MARLSIIERALVFYGICVPDHPRKWWLHDRLRRSLGVEVDREIEVTREGLRWSLNPRNFGHGSLFWLGTKDRWDLHHLRRLIGPGSVILDVGANFGYYSLTLANALDRRCRVHAFEPNPSNFDLLRRHVVMNGLERIIQAHPLGVSDRPEIVSMSEPADNSGHAAVGPGGEIHGVTLTTLDLFCEEVGLDRLDAVILDVEGLEERALRGATRTIGRFKPLVFVELFPPVMGRQGASPAAAAWVLSELGYQLFVARRGRLEPLTEMPVGDRRENAFGFHRDNLPDSLREPSPKNS